VSYPNEPESKFPKLGEIGVSNQKPGLGQIGWTYLGVFVIVAAVLSVAMLADVLLNQKVDLISNIALLLICPIAAWKVRTNDYLAAIWAVPLVWFAVLMTIGQLAPKRGGSFLREQSLHIAYGLAAHAGWIIGATVISGAIAVIRRGRNS
jgi:hypothetical protein